MNRSLKVKRIYSLGQYQNIEFTDEITDIPDRFATNEKLLDELSYIQLLRMELLINKYLQIRVHNANKSPEEIIALIESDRDESYNKILKLITEGE